MEVGYKPHAIQPELGEQPFNPRTYQKAIAKGKIEMKLVAGTDMLADALTKALEGVKLGEFGVEIGLR
jgi:hypothetical protein